MIFRGYPELESIFTPLSGKTMLEFGNKKTDGIVWKGYFDGLGFRHVSVDINGADGALKMDLRQPLNLGTFDVVTNVGTSEHVSEQEPLWRNVAEAMHVGSLFISVTPLPGCWDWHGWWYPTEDFYKDFARKNGMDVERLLVDGPKAKSQIYTRIVRVKECDFAMPDMALMYFNKGGKKYEWR